MSPHLDVALQKNKHTVLIQSLSTVQMLYIRFRPIHTAERLHSPIESAMTITYFLRIFFVFVRLNTVFNKSY